MEQKKKVYLSEFIAPVAQELLKENFTVTDSFEEVNDLYGILTRNVPVTKKIMLQNPGLKIISVHGTGTDMVDKTAAAQLGIQVCNTPGLNAQSVAELSLALILNLLRKVKPADFQTCRGLVTVPASSIFLGNELYNKTIGFIGSGNIARKLAAITKSAFRTTNLCWNPRRNSEEIKNLGFVKIDSLKELFETCDIISIHVPLTSDTRNLIDKNILDHAKSGLILINTARGKIVNEEDLFEALINNKLKAAACDVFDGDLPAKNNPLLGLENFIATPHIGGNTQECLDTVGLAAVKNLLS